MLICASQLVAQTVAPTPAQATAPAIDAKQVEHMRAQLADWPALERYRSDNANLPAPQPGEQRVVFFGDSITDGWGRSSGSGPFFPGKPYVNRGISGQTTPQMLVRFEQDVVHLHPAAVVILAGTNDIAGNTGPSTPQMIEDNFTAMASIAKQSGIKVVLASITPAFAYPWKPSVDPVEEIRELNRWLRDFCASNGYTYLDYYSSMTDDRGAMLQGYSSDGVHPTAKGYAVMAPLAERVLAQALGQSETNR
ncbi:MAG: SGNH/GDSL hydrolase family protein [Acidobacteriota bacterium]|nr:SGNH/GDSL hydrolase family protein [Acidobacteriota bacterium]